ncbi:MAG: hypothetical protein QXS00_02445 [Pyrobaculum sp.]|uniref:hypothetical protein n=1 Tax=Pyrobaculum sp. TaxID=2004705 RepID=UPI00316A105B
MRLAYVKGPPVAVFAGSWRCSTSPVDGVPIALGEPFGDCDPGVAKLISIATTVRYVKLMGAKVYVSNSLGEEGVDAAFAGGADGVLEELSHAWGEYKEGAKFVVFSTSDVAELVNAVRGVAERAGRPFDVLVATSFDKAHVFVPYADGIVVTGGWVGIELAEVSRLPEIGRCINCGVDYLMYSGSLRRCIYCGRRLIRVISSTRPPRSRAVFRSVFNKYKGLSSLRLKIA